MVGSITTTPPVIELPPGSSPSSIAKGDTGSAGPANVLTIGTVTNGGAAAATITGTAPSQVLNLTLPQGPTGPTGPTGPSGAVGAAGTPTVNQFATWQNSTTVQGVSITGLVKGNGASAPAAAVAGTDYLAPPSGSAILKANSGGALANAVAGTDYYAPGGTKVAIADGGTAAGTAYAGYDALTIHGADIASASTINLDTATGNIVDVTGTVTITAITLSDGKERTVRFTGILTLTNGASLVLPSGANITTAAGDYAIFRGYAAGVVRCAFYQKASGAAVVSSGGASFTSAPGGRITLASGVPVMQSSQAGTTTVYYTPSAGDYVPIYNGTSMTMTQFTELSQATTDATKSPAAVAASKVYDLFVWNDAGTMRCTRGPAWTNNTTRGYTFTMQNGILLNTSAITNGPGASRGTWVGTIASNGSSTIDYIFGASASGGTAASLMVWNAYNRVNTSTTVKDSGTSYTYNSATVRQARASAGNQIGFLLGAQEDGVPFNYAASSINAASVSAVALIGVGFDITNANSINASGVQNQGATAITNNVPNGGVWSAGIGVHILAAVENAGASTVDTFNAQGSTLPNALMATIRN